MSTGNRIPDRDPRRAERPLLKTAPLYCRARAARAASVNAAAMRFVASPPQSGSRPTVCTRSSRARLPASPPFIVAGPP
jgi:hypothetical protein